MSDLRTKYILRIFSRCEEDMNVKFYIQGLLGLGPGDLGKILWISSCNSNTMKIFLYKNSKNCWKNVFSKIFKTLKLPANTDLYVHIMYFNSSNTFKFLGQFRKRP